MKRLQGIQTRGGYNPPPSGPKPPPPVTRVVNYPEIVESEKEELKQKKIVHKGRMLRYECD